MVLCHGNRQTTKLDKISIHKRLLDKPQKLNEGEWLGESGRTSVLLLGGGYIRGADALL